MIKRPPEIDFIADKAGKSVGICERIGRRRILAIGDSDSDMQRVEYAIAGEGRRLGLFVYHTNTDFKYAFDRKSRVGTPDRALDQAEADGWIIVDMKNDWKTVFLEEHGHRQASIDCYRRTEVFGTTTRVRCLPSNDKEETVRPILLLVVSNVRKVFARTRRCRMLVARRRITAA